MALATQCPHCHTTFRVAQDQLKLRAGLVRCGHCKEIFNGIEHLLPPTAKSQPPQAAPAPTPAPTPAAAPVFTPAPAFVTPPTAQTDVATPAPPEPLIAQTEEPAAEAASTVAEEEPTEAPPVQIPEEAPVQAKSTPPAPDAGQEKTAPPARPDPLQRMTLLDFTHELPDDLEAFTDYPTEQLSRDETAAPAQSDELEEAIRDLQSKPWRSKKKSAKKRRQKQPPDPLDEEDEIGDEEEPGFLKRGRRKQRLSRRLRIVFGSGSAILLIAALLQGAYAFRNQLAGPFPQAKPWLTQLCNLAGCRIDLPAQISSVSIESSELQTLASANNRFVLTTLLRNYSTTAQEWPYIELTLNDGNEKPLLRRVFKPAEYLPGRDEALAGFPAASERTIKIGFELSQVQASGYRVYLFYP
jgi:predicted Zn finger-like uncharacterized protein